MPALFAVVWTWLLEERATQLQEILDTQHAPSVSQYLCWLSSTLVVIVVSASTLSYHDKSDLLNKYLVMHCDADCSLELLNTDLITHPLSQFSYWLFFFTCCDHQSTTASLMPAPYIPYNWLETCGRYYLYEVGFLMVAGCLSMARFQWKLNLWKV